MNEEHPLTSASIRNHKRQVFWQIVFPFIVIAVLLIAVAVWIAFFGDVKPNSLWRDISLIWMLVPMLILALILVIVLGFLIYGLARLNSAAPKVTGRAQELTRQGAEYVQKFADGAAKPMILIEQAGAAIRSIFTHQRRS